MSLLDYVKRLEASLAIPWIFTYKYTSWFTKIYLSDKSDLGLEAITDMGCKAALAASQCTSSTNAVLRKIGRV